MSRFGNLDPQDPEYASVADFVEHQIDNDLTVFTHTQLQCLCYRLERSVAPVKAELLDYGLTQVSRPHERRFRGFTSNCHDRWAGNPCGGGSGWDAIVGLSL